MHLNMDILLLGYENSGKSTILNKFINGNNVEKTIGVSFISKLLHYENDDFFLCRFWDMSGAHMYKSFIKDYLRKVHTVFIFYDVTNKQSFNYAKDLVRKIYKSKKIILVGNKTDLHFSRKVNMFDINNCLNDFKNENIHLYHIETSKNNITSFRKVIKHLCTKRIHLIENSKYLITKKSDNSWWEMLNWS